MKNKVKWSKEFDFLREKAYLVPTCPDCFIEGEFPFTIDFDTMKCNVCGKVYEKDFAVRKYIRRFWKNKTKVKHGHKTEIPYIDENGELNFKKTMCDGEMTEVYYKRFGKWELGHAECKKCGLKIIV